jgi:hypothetical protein
MNQALSLRPAQAARALVLLAALGFTALVGLAAFETELPADGPAAPLAAAASPARPAESTDGSRVLGDVLTPRFERSDEPAIEMSEYNAHGG